MIVLVALALAALGLVVYLAALFSYWRMSDLAHPERSEGALPALLVPPEDE